MTFNSKLKLIAIFMVAALGVLFFVFAESDVELVKEVNILNDLGFTQKAEIKFSYVQKINQGTELLEKSAPLEFTSDRFGNIMEKQIAFAVLNAETGEVFEKRAWIKQSEAENYRQTGTLNMSMLEKGKDIRIKPVWFNSFNSDYRILDHPEMVIVANKYLFPSSSLAGSLRSDGSYTDIIYMPYSGGLYNQEIVNAGAEHLNQIVEKAFGELESAGVLSRAQPNRLATEIVSRELVKNIILVEHIDPDAFNRADKARRRELLERVLVIIGGNRGRAYSFTGSPAGASGIAQFIRPTYEQMVRLYPRAELATDYREGMADHLNAAKAMVLFFDRHIENLQQAIGRQDLVKFLGVSEEMLAASYNGGPSRVVRSVNAYGLAWINSHFNSPELAGIFRRETIDYVKKFQFVRDQRMF